MTVRTYRTTRHVLEPENLELTFAPRDGETQHHVLADGRHVVGYLVHDEDCENPLDDCEGMGKIYDCRHRGESERIAREALGIKQYGATEDDDGQPYEKNPYCVLLDVYSHSGEAWRVHGGGRYFPDEQWDVSNGAGVWLPEKCCIEHIEITAYQAVVDPDWYARWQKDPRTSGVPALQITSECRHKEDAETGKTKYWTVYGWRLSEDRRRSGYKTLNRAAAQGMLAGALILPLGKQFNKEGFQRIAREVAVVCAEQAVETYNAWSSGDCWGVCVDVFEKDGNRLDEDCHACWGYVGSKWAEQELTEEIQYFTGETNHVDRPDELPS